MSKIAKTLADVGDAAQSTQQSLKQEVRLSSETVGMGRETMSMGRETMGMGRETMRMGRELVYSSRALGALMAVALLLLIVLETQWIRYWGRKLAATK